MPDIILIYEDPECRIEVEMEDSFLSTSEFHMKARIDVSALSWATALNLHTSGTISEKTDFSAFVWMISKLRDRLRLIQVDMASLLNITETGAENWQSLVNEIGKDIKITYRNMREPFLNFISLRNTLLGINSAIESLEVPYYCDTCSLEVLEILTPEQIAILGGKVSFPSLHCRTCQNQLKFHRPVEDYLWLVELLPNQEPNPTPNKEKIRK